LEQAAAHQIGERPEQEPAPRNQRDGTTTLRPTRTSQAANRVNAPLTQASTFSAPGTKAQADGPWSIRSAALSSRPLFAATGAPAARSPRRRPRHTAGITKGSRPTVRGGRAFRALSAPAEPARAGAADGGRGNDACHPERHTHAGGGQAPAREGDSSPPWTRPRPRFWTRPRAPRASTGRASPARTAARSIAPRFRFPTCEQIAAVQRGGGAALVREKIAALSEGERHVLRDALTEAPRS
jgi:hypothetical protein